MYSLTAVERRSSTNAARMRRLALVNTAPYLHCHTMAEIETVARRQGVSFSDAYELHKRAMAARYPFLR
jgi:hypothetical protein